MAIELVLADEAVDEANEFAVHAWLRSDHVAPFQPAIAAGEIAEHSTGLGDQQRPRGDVPRREMQLEETVEDAGRGVGEVDRGRSGASNAFRDADHFLKDLAVDGDELLCAERETRGEEGPIHRRLIRDV